MRTCPTTAPRPLRKDAERNRERILAAARELFAEQGLTVTLDDIARHAGVGVGTVYRRFPDKEQLIDALFEDRLGEIAAVATESAEIERPVARARALPRARARAAGGRPRRSRSSCSAPPTGTRASNAGAR